MFYFRDLTSEGMELFHIYQATSFIIKCANIKISATKLNYCNRFIGSDFDHALYFYLFLSSNGFRKQFRGDRRFKKQLVVFGGLPIKGHVDTTHLQGILNPKQLAH